MKFKKKKKNAQKNNHKKIITFLKKNGLTTNK